MYTYIVQLKIYLRFFRIRVVVMESDDQGLWCS